MSKRTKYSKAFKLSALSLLRDGKILTQIPEDLGLRRATLSVWKKQLQMYGEGAFAGAEKSLPKNEFQKELKRLKRENTALKMERDILKKALKIFSKSDR